MANSEFSNGKKLISIIMGDAGANPDRKIICACGDGDYLMAGFELIPVICVIFDNSEFNVIKKFLLNNFGEHAFMEIKNPDYTPRPAEQKVGKSKTIRRGSQASRA